MSAETFDVTLEYAGQIIKLAAYNKPAELGVTLTKTGIKEVLAGSKMSYRFTIANTSNVDLQNFYFHDKIPYDVTTASALTTGTYNARLTYRILYKTNYNDYRVLASNLLSTNNYSFGLSGLQLMAGEVVTDIYFDFGTVPSGFQSVTKPTLMVSVNPRTANKYYVTNRAGAGGKFGETWQSANASWIKRELCAVVVPYRIPILIRESEMWELGEERPDFVLRNMVGASIDVIVTKVERTANRAQASRRQASRSQRRFFAAREDIHAVGSRITCRMLAVGPRRCLVDCYGYDLDMTQREIRYAAIPDLRTEFHPGSEIDCIVKEYHPRTGELIVSAKETEVNPFFGAEERHPVGSRRFAMISGKYGGGVFCNLPDGVTCMCNYSYQHEDADFMVGEHVMLMVQRYDQEKLQMYGKIMSKW